jgi:hypothetical protein
MAKMMAKMMKKSSMKSGMKKMMKKGMKKSAMKGMKRKAMKKSVIAKGKRGKSSVFRGTKVKTSGGLKKSDLKKNKRGKVVSAKSSAAGKKNFKNISKWLKATQAARKSLKIKGFCPIGGKTAAGQRFLKAAKSFFKKA